MAITQNELTKQTYATHSF